MQKFMNAIESKLMPLMTKITSQKHLAAVRDALIATMPLTITGAIALLLVTLPWPQAYVDFIANNPTVSTILMVPFQMTLGLLSIYVSFGIGKNLAKSYDIDGIAGGIAATMTFLTTIGFTSLEQGSFLSTSYLGGEGMFTAIISAFMAIEIMHFCKAKNITIKLPDSVPSNIGSSFDSLIPIAISVLLMSFIIYGLGFDINGLISSVVTPMLSASANSIITPLLYVTLTAIMWFFGLHPAVLAAVLSPVWTVNATANLDAAAAGLAIPNIGVQPFIFTFCFIGGGGATLALCLFMCFSKSKSLKSLGRLSLVPGLFNINEPILFGAPIVLNPILIIPALIGPLLCVITTYIALTTNIVPGIAYASAAAWNFPSPFAAALSTSSWQAVALVIMNFIITGIVYYPFFKMYEKKYLLDEQEGEMIHAKEQ